MEEEIKTKKETEVEKKKDIKPIILYIVIQLLLPIIIGVFLGATENNMENEIFVEKINLLGFLMSNILIFFIFLLMYWNRIIENIKKIRKNTLIKVIFVSIIIAICNEIISRIFEYFNIPMENQEQLIGYLKKQPFLVGISISIFVPFIEEFVFRYSIESASKKKLKFIVVSSIIFGLMHGLGIATILYAAIGAVLAIIYLRTDKNITYPIIAHIINNIIAVITIILWA